MARTFDEPHFEDTRVALGVALRRLIATIQGEQVTLRELLALVGEQGLLLFCVVLTLPFLLPVSIPGVSTLFGLVIILVSLGITGAWMSTFTALAPYKWWLIGASLGCLAYAWYRIYRAPSADAAACVAVPGGFALARLLFWAVCALVLAAIVSPYLVPIFFEA